MVRPRDVTICAAELRFSPRWRRLAPGAPTSSCGGRRGGLWTTVSETDMQTNLTRRLFLCNATASVLALGMFGAAPAVRAQETIEEITWALPAINDTMFVPRAWSTYVGAIMSLVQEGPLAFADDLSLTPGVAESWEQVDPTTYKYILRQAVTFGDGSPLTPDDVVAIIPVSHESKRRFAARRILLFRRLG